MTLKKTLIPSSDSANVSQQFNKNILFYAID